MRGNIIERALELASQCGTIEQVRKKLSREGYMNVDAHLTGRFIKQQIKDRLNPELKRLSRLPAAERRGD